VSHDRWVHNPKVCGKILNRVVCAAELRDGAWASVKMSSRRYSKVLYSTFPNFLFLFRKQSETTGNKGFLGDCDAAFYTGCTSGFLFGSSHRVAYVTANSVGALTWTDEFRHDRKLVEKAKRLVGPMPDWAGKKLFQPRRGCHCALALAQGGESGVGTSGFRGDLVTGEFAS